MTSLTAKFLSIETVSRSDTPQASSDHRMLADSNVYRPASRPRTIYSIRLPSCLVDRKSERRVLNCNHLIFDTVLILVIQRSSLVAQPVGTEGRLHSLRRSRETQPTAREGTTTGRTRPPSLQPTAPEGMKRELNSVSTSISHSPDAI